MEREDKVGWVLGESWIRGGWLESLGLGLPPPMFPPVFQPILSPCSNHIMFPMPLSVGGGVSRLHSRREIARHSFSSSGSTQQVCTHFRFLHSLKQWTCHTRDSGTYLCDSQTLQCIKKQQHHQYSHHWHKYQQQQQREHLINMPMRNVAALTTRTLATTATRATTASAATMSVATAMAAATAGMPPC
jgi:hypothetical protein